MQITGDTTTANGSRTTAGNESYGKLLGGSILWVSGFGGFFDGIAFHQLPQWHHMLTSAGYLPDSVANLQVNTLADGAFHAATPTCSRLAACSSYGGRYPGCVVAGQDGICWGR